jgi:branched-chain amino acid transport system ATP-binding protein
MSNPLLQLEGVSVRFGGLQVIKDLDLHVDEGEVVSVIGPNGAGKTTLFNLITGVYRPDAGDIRFEGGSIVGMEPHRITERGIARTFQSLRLFLNMSVKENVMMATWGHTKSGVWSSIFRTPRQRREEREIAALAEQRLAFFGERLMGYRWSQPAYSLSYANRRRLEIARATATRPRLLLLDEPAAGMNPQETAEITDLIGKLRDEGGYTVLVIEHDMHVVKGVSDRVVALDHGVKIAEGSYDTVATAPQVVEAYLGTGAGNGSAPARNGARSAAEPRDRETTSSPLLRLDGVSTYYGEMRILTDVNLEVHEGELVSLLGGNASGKSTTLKTILGIVRPRTGGVLLDGEDITDRSTSYRIANGIAIVPENRRLFPPLTVLENLELGAYLRGRPDEEDFERIYSLFPLLYERRDQKAGTLSGGEQQMVAIARALMCRPRLLLMDEPSMGLAPQLVERSFEIIKQVHDAGVAVLVVEQNANMALSIADRGYVLATGQVVLADGASELLQNDELRQAYLGG